MMCRPPAPARGRQHADPPEPGTNGRKQFVYVIEWDHKTSIPRSVVGGQVDGQGIGRDLLTAMDTSGGFNGFISGSFFRTLTFRLDDQQPGMGAL